MTEKTISHCRILEKLGGGRATQLTFDDGQRWPSSWPPSDDRVAYEYAETTGNIWVMELK